MTHATTIKALEKAQARVDSLRAEYHDLQQRAESLEATITANAPAVATMQAAAVRTATKTDDKAAAEAEAQLQAQRVDLDRLNAAIDATQVDLVSAEQLLEEATVNERLARLADALEEARAEAVKVDEALDTLANHAGNAASLVNEIASIRRALGKGNGIGTVDKAGHVINMRVQAAMGTIKGYPNIARTVSGHFNIR